MEVEFMHSKKTSGAGASISRRDFLASSVTAGLVLAGAGALASAQAQEAGAPQAAGGNKNPGDLNVALIGFGCQGRVLADSCANIPGIRFTAVCDIWDYARQQAVQRLGVYGHKVNVYENYVEMLSQEKDLQAAIIATPDWMHAEQAKACMEAGLHVYCEKGMATNLEDAKSMVEASRKTQKLLQIGHQRRSNPRYQHAIDKVLTQEKLLGRVTQGYGQWNRAKTPLLSWPSKFTIKQETLDLYGYDNMVQMRNWRWFRRYGLGPFADQALHQLDVFNWGFQAPAQAVTAIGGLDYYHDLEWPDTVMAVLDYPFGGGVSRAYYQVLTATSHGGYVENFMGENGTILISEMMMLGNGAERERRAPELWWQELGRRGLLKPPAKAPAAPVTASKKAVDTRATLAGEKWTFPIELAKPVHQPHLENFFNGIRNGEKLNCPGEVGYQALVTVLKTYEALQSGAKVAIAPEVYKV
jgi:predicted dehydrogenase